MSDELSAARRVLARISPDAFVAALTEAERAQLLDALMRDAGMRLVTLHPRSACWLRNTGPTSVAVAYSQHEQVDFRADVGPPVPAQESHAPPGFDFVNRGDGPLHWVPARGTLRGEVHAIDLDSTACGLSLRHGRRFRAAASDADFGAASTSRCRRCWGSFRAAGGPP